MKYSLNYSFVTFDKNLNLQSIDHLPRSDGATRVRLFIRTSRGELAGELRNTVNTRDVNTRQVNTRDNAYRVGHGMIGTVLIAFDGDPLMILVLIAR